MNKKATTLIAIPAITLASLLRADNTAVKPSVQKAEDTNLSSLVIALERQAYSPPSPQSLKLMFYVRESGNPTTVSSDSSLGFLLKPAQDVQFATKLDVAGERMGVVTAVSLKW